MHNEIEVERDEIRNVHGLNSKVFHATPCWLIKVKRVSSSSSLPRLVAIRLDTISRGVISPGTGHRSPNHSRDNHPNMHDPLGCLILFLEVPAALLPYKAITVYVGVLMLSIR